MERHGSSVMNFPFLMMILENKLFPLFHNFIVKMDERIFYFTQLNNIKFLLSDLVSTAFNKPKFKFKSPFNVSPVVII